MKTSDIRCGLFATRMNVAEALEYFAEVTGNDPFAMTGLMVVLNTVADVLDREGLESSRRVRLLNNTPKHNAHVVEWSNQL